MKKLKLLIGAVFLAAVINTQAQTNIANDFENLWKDTAGSSNAVYAVAGERKLTGDAWKVAAVGLFNINDYAAAGIGVAHEWTPSHEAAPNSFNLTVDFQAQLPFTPFANFGWTNFILTPFAFAGTGTPFAGQNQGNLMIVTRAGAHLDIYAFKIKSAPVTIGAGGFYGNETGTGYYQGNWAGGYVSFNVGGASDPVIADNRNANSWTAQAFAANQ